MIATYKRIHEAESHYSQSFHALEPEYEVVREFYAHEFTLLKQIRADHLAAKRRGPTVKLSQRFVITMQ
ncbi:hypothetical protein GQ600_7853 [Phytophthora cactorum]|nr:hypothetical protein GQ600_7853 [Phytophthora cactorum]